MGSPQDELKVVYEQLCDSYRAIDDFRTKLLSLLPLVSETDGMKSLGKFLFPIALFGLVVTVGLLCYEIHGIKKCSWLISVTEPFS
jgi:hypothetical protein